MRALSKTITGLAAIAVVMGMASAGGSALAGTAVRQSAVASPGIYAPPDMVVGEADGSVSLPVTLSAPGQSTVTVNYAVYSGSASGAGPACSAPDILFAGQSGTLTFAPGVTSQTVKVTLYDCHNSSSIGFRYFYLDLSSNSPDSSIARAMSQVAITGDAAAPATPGLYVRTAVVDAHAGSVRIPVVLGGPTGAAQGIPVTVHYTTHDGSAKAGTDYARTSGTLTFPAGSTAQNITVPIMARSGSAPARSFTVSLDSPSNATITYGTGTVTIGASGASAVASPGISAPPDMVIGETDGYVDLPVTLSAPGQGTVTVNYAAYSGEADGAGPACSAPFILFAGFSGTLTFTPGVTTQVARIPLYDCQSSSSIGFRQFYFELSSSSPDSSIMRAMSEVAITGDAAASGTPALSVRDATVDAHAGSVQVPVVLGGPSGLAQGVPVTVHYSTADGSAKAGTDYAATSGTLTFPPGETAQNITVPIIDRSGAAPARSFSLTLSAPSSATVADGTGVVTIGASGAAPVASPRISAPPNTTVSEAAGYADLPVTLSSPGQGRVTLSYALYSGTADGAGPACSAPIIVFAGFSGTLTFTPGVTTQTVRVPLYNCGTSGPLTFTLNLITATGGTIAGTGISTITIVQSAKVPAAPSGVAATPGNGRATVTFTAPASDGGESVNYYRVTASPGGATATGISSPITVTGLKNGTVYTFKVTAANSVGTGPASAASNTVVPLNFAARPGTATDISVGANGSVWAVGSASVAGGHPVYRWNGSKWVLVAGGAVVIAVDPHGNPWIINSSHKISHWSGSKWVAVSGTATDISVGANGSVWALGTANVAGGHPILRWNGSKWVTVAGGAVVIGVDPHGNPWIINSSHKISQRSGSKWVAVAGTATDIAVGANGAVWDVGTGTVPGGHPVYERIGSGWVKSPGVAVLVAVDPHGNPWIANSSHKIYLG